MKLIEKAATGFHIFVGIGAIAGGSAAILDPLNPLGMPASEALVNSPFTDFFVPGLFLFCVLGIGNLFAALSFLRKWRLRGWTSGFFAVALAAWIVVQCIMLWTVAALHVIFFLIGAAQGMLALAILRGNMSCESL